MKKPHTLIHTPDISLPLFRLLSGEMGDPSFSHFKDQTLFRGREKKKSIWSDGGVCSPAGQWVNEGNEAILLVHSTDQTLSFHKSKASKGP